MIEKIYVPFDKNGEMMGYTSWIMTDAQKKQCDEQGYFDITYPNGALAAKWKPNYEFEDVLLCEGIESASSKNTLFRSLTDGKVYSMFLGDLCDAVHLMTSGVLNGTFTFAKLGDCYGVRMVRHGDY